MSDLIEKQAIIDALLSKMDTIDDKPDVVLGMAVAAGMIKDMPSALDQEPCTDAISRQAVIEAIRKCHCEEWIKADIGASIEALPSVTPAEKVSRSGNPNKWIPVSERLPEDIKPVIVTWKNTDPKSYYQYIVGKHFIGTAHYKSGKWYWYSSVTEDLLAEYGKCDSEEFDEAIEVVAWMPLPEPYKAESEDKE